MRERDVEARLVRKITAAGGIAFKFVSPGRDGVPDRIVVMPGGRVYFAELKTDTGRLTTLQQRQLQLLQELGCDARVLYGMDGVDAFAEEVTPNEVHPA